LRNQYLTERSTLTGRTDVLHSACGSATGRGLQCAHDGLATALNR